MEILQRECATYYTKEGKRQKVKGKSSAGEKIISQKERRRQK
jgi:hypothetical protein